MLGHEAGVFDAHAEAESAHGAGICDALVQLLDNCPTQT